MWFWLHVVRIVLALWRNAVTECSRSGGPAGASGVFRREILPRLPIRTTDIAARSRLSYLQLLDYNQAQCLQPLHVTARDVMSERGARDMLERAEHAATAGDFASADELLRSAAGIQEDTLGPLHPDLANTFNNLAIVAEKTGNLGDAETFYRRAVAIASASLPPDHPMVVASRENLESFCRARGVSIDAPAPLSPTRETDVGPETSIAEQPVVAATTPAIERPASAADPPEVPPRTSVTPRSIPGPSLPVASKPMPGAAVPAGGSHLILGVAIAVVVFLVVLLVWRPWSSRNPSAPASADVVPPRHDAQRPGPATIESPAPPKTAPLRGTEGVADSKSAAPTGGAVTLVAAELCRSFSTNGRNWRCERVEDSVAPGSLVLYTRVRSARADTVVHRWYQGDTLRQSVRLAIGVNTSEGYRTYSRQTVKPGDWRVEVRSADNNPLNEQRFSVR
jgi:hypothetical protein